MDAYVNAGVPEFLLRRANSLHDYGRTLSASEHTHIHVHGGPQHRQVNGAFDVYQLMGALAMASPHAAHVFAHNIKYKRTAAQQREQQAQQQEPEQQGQQPGSRVFLAKLFKEFKDKLGSIGPEELKKEEAVGTSWDFSGVIYCLAGLLKNSAAARSELHLNYGSPIDDIKRGFTDSLWAVVLSPLTQVCGRDPSPLH